MTSTDVEIKSENAISLKGSTELITDFFYFGLNNILYQRGVYPADSFDKIPKYGLTLFTTGDGKLKSFLSQVLDQMRSWLVSKELRKVVIVIADALTKETLERWQFDINCSGDDHTTTTTATDAKENDPKTKTANKVRKEMAEVMRQITASITFLPYLETRCAFDVLMYTKKDTETPSDWDESGPCFVANSEQVQLKSVSTPFHAVDTKVTYKLMD